MKRIWLLGLSTLLLALTGAVPAEPILGTSLEVAQPSIVAYGEKAPRGWEQKGKVEGLLGEDWWQKKTTHTVCYGRLGDLTYVDEVVEGLETSYSVNQGFLGMTPPNLPLEFYFCSMNEPANLQPKFIPWLRGMTRFAGVALGGTKMCCVNLGDARHSKPYAPWEMAETARHEMNHLFAFQLKGQDRNHSWGWLYEALAETVEDTVKPRGAQMTLAGMKTFMKGYRAVDANWGAMVKERNAQDQEQYRDYEKLLMSIIMFLQEKYGRNSIANLMRNCRSNDLEEAFSKTYGVGTKGLEDAWKAFYDIH